MQQRIYYYSIFFKKFGSATSVPLDLFKGGMSFKQYCDNITSNVSIFSETWGWFIDLETQQLTNKIILSTKPIINNTNNKPIANNKFLFYKNKIQIYKENVTRILHNHSNNTKKRPNTNSIRSRQSISSKLSELELQFQMDEQEEDNEDEEKVITRNNIYTKLIQGFCLIAVLLVIVG